MCDIHFFIENMKTGRAGLRAWNVGLVATLAIGLREEFFARTRRPQISSIQDGDSETTEMKTITPNDWSSHMKCLHFMNVETSALELMMRHTIEYRDQSLLYEAHFHFNRSVIK